MKKRYFMTADLDIFRVEYATKKEMLSLMKDAKDSSYGNNNGFTDNYFDAVAVETKDYFRLSEEETAKDKTLDFKYFVEGFMKCKYRELMDSGSTRVINMTFDELISYLHKDCKGIYKTKMWSKKAV